MSERGMNKEKWENYPNVPIALSCNLSELLKCFLLYPLLSAPPSLAVSQPAQTVRVSKPLRARILYSLVTDGGVDKALAFPHSFTHTDTHNGLSAPCNPPHLRMYAYGCMGTTTSQCVCIVCVCLYGCVRGSGFTSFVLVGFHSKYRGLCEQCKYYTEASCN